MRKFLVAELSMPVGAIAAIVLVLGVTHSRLGDIGEPIDIILLLGIAAVGAVGITIFVYTLQSFFRTAR